MMLGMVYQMTLETGGFILFLCQQADLSTTYRVTDMCGSPANSTGWMEPGTLHSVVMNG